MRTSGFTHRNFLRTSAARWLLIIATATVATACSDGALRGFAGKTANVRPKPTSLADKAKSADLLRDGDAEREKGDLDAAAVKYNAAVAADPNSVAAELRLGSLDLALKNESGATSAYQTAQNLAPKDPEAAFRLGEIELTHGAAKAAADQFAIALENRKDDPKLYNAMGVALSMQGQYAEAKENYDKGLALEPDYPSLHNNFGLMQLASGDLFGALATFSALVESPQTNDRYRLNRAMVELALGQTDAAMADAPGVDEAALRQTLAIYRAPPQQSASPDLRVSAEALTSDDSAKSPLPSVHLAVDPAPPSPAADTPPPASVNPAAGLPPPASP
ncbi:MAG TPA: tetratricopeptide repeat protein [Stellaceae bacterium]